MLRDGGVVDEIVARDGFRCAPYSSPDIFMSGGGWSSYHE
jgi:hypothetical protein